MSEENYSDEENENLGELSWSSEITDGERQLLEKGTYRFRVASFSKSRFQPRPGSKIPPCPRAILQLDILDDSNRVLTTLEDSLLLCQSMVWKLASFFRSLGLKEHGKSFRMDWNLVPNAQGRLELGVRVYDKADGTVGKSNQVEKYLDPDPADEKIPF